MALTQVSSAGIKNAEVKTEDILDANITTAKIADDAVTADKLANSINTEIAANTAKVSLENDSVTGAKIADDAVGAEHIEVLDANLEFADDVKVQFGAGDDLEIYHSSNGSSYIKELGSGNLYIYSANLRIMNAPDGSEPYIEANNNGNVELYYDGTKKFETDPNGVLQGDNSWHYWGDSDDLYIGHNGTNSYIVNTTGALHIRNDGIYFKNAAGSENFIDCSPNAEVSLFYDNSKKLETVSAGAKIYQDLDLIGDTPQLKFDDTRSSGYQSYINTNHNELKIMASAGGFGVYCGTDANGANNTTQRFWVNGAGLVRLPTDDSKLQIGASQDIEIYHNGTYSFIKNATGSLTLQSPGLIQLLNADASEYYIEAVENGAVSLYYDNGKVFETTASGAKVSGILECTSHVKLGDNDVFVAGAGDDLQIYHDGNNSYIHDSGTGSLILRSSRVSFNDTSNNENARLDSDGLKFNGDSAAANALSDYEEGSFTAAITVDTGTNPSQNAYTHRYAYYRKIGKIVHFRVDVQFGAISSTGSGSAVLSGLPFASSNSTQAYGVTFSSGYSPNWGTNNHPTAAYINTNSSEMYLMKNTVADGVSYVNSANIVNGTRLICGGSYMTDS